MLTDICDSAGFIIRITAKLVKYLHIIVPIILIVFITFDLFKALTSDMDDKSKKEAFSKATKRMIYAIIVFLIPTIIMFVFRNINKLITNDNKTSTTSTSWINCWLAVYSGTSYNSAYGSTSYSPNRTSTPRPAVTARLSKVTTPPPTVAPCSAYTTSSSCSNAGCHWNNNTCSTTIPASVNNYLCCYYDQNSGLYNYTYTTNATTCSGQLKGIPGESKESCCDKNGSNGCNPTQPTASPPPVQVYSCCWYENGMRRYSEDVEYWSCRNQNGDANYTIEECCDGFGYSDLNQCRAKFPY